MSLRLWLVVAPASALFGCSDAAYLGSDLHWFAENEGADTSEWSEDSAGGLFAGLSGSSVELSIEQAHGGSQSIHFVTPAAGEDSGGNMYRNVAVPSEAYYSAWYFIPEGYTFRSHFTIMKFHSYAPDDPQLFADGIDIRLRDIKNGSYVLYVFHHDGAFLQPPLAVPTPLVEVQRWFHVEVFFRAARDATGSVAVWLDGRPLYDLEARPTAIRETAYFSVCDMTKEAEPEPVEVYVDDVAVSRTRVTERGRLGP